MRVLLLATVYSSNPANPDLTAELAEGLQSEGHEVTVVALSWSGSDRESDTVSASGVRVLQFSPVAPRFVPGPLRKALKWGFTSARVARRLRAMLRWDFDLIVGFSPAVTFRSLLPMAKKLSGAASFLIYWDFFPIHHVQIGLLPAVAEPIARTLERRAISRFDGVGLMTPRNVAFFRQYHPGLSRTPVEVLPLWARVVDEPAPDRGRTRERAGLPADGLLVVFGGQLTAGRGLEDLLALAERTKDTLSNVRFVVIGAGPMFESLRRQLVARGLANVTLLPRIPRKDYFSLLRACDIGLVATVKDVSVPTFPSKTLDYFRAALPVLAATESTTDYGEILENEARAGLCSTAGDIGALEANLRRLAGDSKLRSALGTNGREFLGARMNVTSTCRRLADFASRGKRSGSAT